MNKKQYFRMFILFVTVISCAPLRIYQQTQKCRIRQTGKRSAWDNQAFSELTPVSESKSIKYLNQCKDICLQMHQIYPFEFKYHRLVYRQSEGLMKYITGQCLYAFRDEIPSNQQSSNSNSQTGKTEKQRKWRNWAQLKSYIDISVLPDAASDEQKKAWQGYMADCQDQSLKLSQISRIDFKFTLVHSDFQYYQNGGFKNLQPFDDLDGLLSGLYPSRM